jgi:hypothetical protein
MNTYQERVLQSFRRVQGWFAANPQYVAKDGPASTPALAAQLDALNGVVQRVSDHAAQQQTQLAQSLLVSKDEYDRRRDLLGVHMASIAKVARALRGTVPGIGVLTMPRGNIESAALIGAATVMARKAEIYKEVLIENALPADFIEARRRDRGAEGLSRRPRPRESGPSVRDAGTANGNCGRAAHRGDHGCDAAASAATSAGEAGRVAAAEARRGEGERRSRPSSRCSELTASHRELAASRRELTKSRRELTEGRRRLTSAGRELTGADRNVADAGEDGSIADEVRI